MQLKDCILRHQCSTVHFDRGEDMAAFKTTVLADIEKEYGAKMTPTGGWSLAKNFPGGVSAEERHTVDNCSVFDRCHTARFRVTGVDVFKKLCEVINFETSSSAVEDVFTGVFAEQNITLLCMAEDDFLLLAEKHSTIVEIAGKVQELEFSDLSVALAQLDVAGAKLPQVLEDFEIVFDDLPEAGKLTRIVVAQVNTILFVNNDLPFSCITILFNAEYAEGMWEEFVDTFPVKPAGFSARENLIAKNCE